MSGSRQRELIDRYISAYNAFDIEGMLALVSPDVRFVMRMWSGLFFIPEMLAFQKVPLDSASSAELTARVSKWTFWAWFREPLDFISFLCSLLALSSLKR